jgi:hypothetical protein
MAPYLAAVRNYWSLLPAMAVIVVLILVYAVPTLINPQWTSSILALFRQHPADPQATEEERRRAAGALSPQQVRSRRMLAVALVLCAVGLIGFNVEMNREANGCYTAAKAFGAIDSQDAEDPCVDMIFGSFFGDGSGKPIQDVQQPVTTYQLVHKKHPTYLRWIQHAPKYDEADLLIGTSIDCNLDLRVEEKDDRINVYVDTDSPCPPAPEVSLTAVKLKKPLGDRKIVTADGAEMQQIDPDMDSWWTVLKKLATGG